MELPRLEKRISRLAGQAIRDWSLIDDGDRILVAVSGGKDSYTMVRILERLRRKAPVGFQMTAFHLDQGGEEPSSERVRDALEAIGIPLVDHRSDIYSLVREKLPDGVTRCVLCSRYRRGILYRKAQELGCNKIALGHHRDDVIETFLLNLLFRGRIQAMPAKLRSDDRRNLVIRPLAYVPEELTEAYARLSGFEPLSCGPCTDQATNRRREVKGILKNLEEHYPGAKGNILAALGRIIPSHLYDKRIFITDDEDPDPARAEIKGAES